MFRTSILLVAGSRQGVQFQSPPTIIGNLVALLNILLRSAKNSGQGLLGPYTTHITNSAPFVSVVPECSRCYLSPLHVLKH